MMQVFRCAAASALRPITVRKVERRGKNWPHLLDCEQPLLYRRRVPQSPPNAAGHAASHLPCATLTNSVCKASKLLKGNKEMLERIGKPGYETISVPDRITVGNIRSVLESGNRDLVVAEIGIGIGATSKEIAEL